MKEEDKYQLVEDYLSGKLRPDQQEQWVNFLAQDGSEEFIENVKLAHDVLRTDRLMKIDHLSRIAANQYHKKAFQKRVIKIVVAVTLPSFIALWVYFNQDVPHQEIKNTTVTEQVVKSDTEESPLAPVAGTQQVENNTDYQSPIQEERNEQKEKPVQEESIQIIETTDIPTVIDNRRESLVNRDNQEPKLGESEEVKKQVASRQVVPTINPCDDTKITAQVTSNNTCMDEANGEIKIHNASISGGVAPYSYALNNEESSSLTTRYTGLSEGTYEVHIKDSKGCEIMKEVIVEARKCKYIYSRQEDVYWQLPTNKPCKLTIFNVSGYIVVTKEYYDGDLLQWDGFGNNGEALATGSYVYVIETIDGDKEKGELAIDVR